MLSPRDISAHWDGGEFSALLAPTQADPRALMGRGSRPLGYLSVLGAPWGEVEVPRLGRGAGSWRAKRWGRDGDKALALGPS